MHTDIMVLRVSHKQEANATHHQFQSPTKQHRMPIWFKKKKQINSLSNVVIGLHKHDTFEIIVGQCYTWNYCVKYHLAYHSL